MWNAAIGLNERSPFRVSRAVTHGKKPRSLRTPGATKFTLLRLAF